MPILLTAWTQSLTGASWRRLIAPEDARYRRDKRAADPVHGLAALSSVQLAALERIKQWDRPNANTESAADVLLDVKAILSGERLADVEALLRGENR
jgi:hypothetical protein